MNNMINILNMLTKFTMHKQEQVDKLYLIHNIFIDKRLIERPITVHYKEKSAEEKRRFYEKIYRKKLP